MLCVKFLTVLIVLVSVTQAQGRVKRCYVCHSRGTKGDCKDPFQFNATTVENVKAVDPSPCASGWCAKVIAGADGDHDKATERICLQRPPSDAEERCAKTLYEHKRVFMCFCRGDLCNSSTIPSNSKLMLIITVFIALKIILV